MFSLAAEGRGNIVHKKYPDFVLIKCPVYSSYKVREYMGPKSPKHFSAGTLRQKHQPEITVRCCIIPKLPITARKKTLNKQ